MLFIIKALTENQYSFVWSVFDIKTKQSYWKMSKEKKSILLWMIYLENDAKINSIKSIRVVTVEEIVS